MTITTSVELFTGLHLAGQPLLVPGTVVAEVGYLLARNAGARVESLFLQALADGDFQPVHAAHGVVCQWWMRARRQ
jgi:hypothetical protein